MLDSGCLGCKNGVAVWTAVGWCEEGGRASDVVFGCFMYSKLFEGGICSTAQIAVVRLDSCLSLMCGHDCVR